MGDVGYGQGAHLGRARPCQSGWAPGVGHSDTQQEAHVPQSIDEQQQLFGSQPGPCTFVALIFNTTEAQDPNLVTLQVQSYMRNKPIMLLSWYEDHESMAFIMDEYVAILRKAGYVRYETLRLALTKAQQRIGGRGLKTRLL